MAWKEWHISAIVICLIFLVVLPIGMAYATKIGWLGLSIHVKYIIWFIILLDIFSILAVAGHGSTNRRGGLLIDERNKMSVSRLQLIIWTLAVIPALLTFIYFNIAHGVPDATNIAIPPELWVLLGLSGGATIGAPIINKTKTSLAPTQRVLNLAPNQPHEGVLVVNNIPTNACFADMFMGDELSNYKRLDISKVQMLLITIGLALGYGYGILALLAQTTPPLTSFPIINSNLVVLLAVSQGTYLGNKAAPH